MAQATAEFGRIALKWRALAERRREHFNELYRSGRWKHYYDYGAFIRELRAAMAIAQRWAVIAPKVAPNPEKRKEERRPPDGIPRAKAA